MDKFRITTLLAGIALLTMSVQAPAAIYTVAHTPATPAIVVPPDWASTLDLKIGGDAPVSELISDFTLQALLDDDSQGDSAEWAFLELPGLLEGRLSNSAMRITAGGDAVLGYFRLNTLGTLTAKRRAVPEPNSVALLGLGLAGLGLARRRKATI